MTSEVFNCGYLFFIYSSFRYSYVENFWRNLVIWKSIIYCYKN